jgi:hypothetical protein
MAIDEHLKRWPTVCNADRAEYAIVAARDAESILAMVDIEHVAFTPANTALLAIGWLRHAKADHAVQNLNG